MQINVQNSRLVRDNLINLIQQDPTDIVFVQEKYVLQNKIARIPRAYRTYISKEGKSRKAIIIAKDNIDHVLITQLSCRLNIVLELRYESLRIFTANICLDITEETGIKTAKVAEILQFNKGFGTLIAIDSSSRSTVWHDNQTNSIGTILEKHLISRDLHIMKESEITTFQSRRGRATWT
jgi:hypothetical protein